MAQPPITIKDECSVAALTEDGESNEFLAKPLLDGGQGKNNNNTTLPLPRGDISPGTISHGVSGKDIKKLRLQNKRTRHTLQEQQQHKSMWTTHTGTTMLPATTPLPDKWRGDMCPSGIATSHPAGGLLSEWAQMGCPTRTG